MVTLISPTVVFTSAGSATIASAVDEVSPGANRRVAIIKVGPDKVRFVGYDIA